MASWARIDDGRSDRRLVELRPGRTWSVSLGQTELGRKRVSRTSCCCCPFSLRVYNISNGDSPD